MVPTPICDFVQHYAQSESIRLHMPGHKGSSFLGCESRDITEISGADDLYHADGIIARSEEHASSLFGWNTYYSTEGSSLCIRAMLFLSMRGCTDSKPLILAGRNAHKTFLNTAVLLDFEIAWLYPAQFRSYHSCAITAEDLENALSNVPRKPSAVYLTSPDYLGSVADIAAIAAVCRREQILLLVDNAHGAYLKYLSPSRHPMDLGADLCCDSAHKTLPVLTGGAYLHVKDSAMAAHAREALALFGSTSPSYLILQSLDLANVYMETLPEKLSAFLPLVDHLKKDLAEYGFSLCGSEPLKITLAPKAFGYTGNTLADLLLQQGIVCEFSDPDYIVFMLTPENTADELERLKAALCALPRRVPITDLPARPVNAIIRMSPRQAVFSESETLPAENCIGRVLASANVSCPPAIPIVMCGEEITENAIALFRYYGIEHCTVVK